MRLLGGKRVEEMASGDLCRPGVGLAVNAARRIPPRRDLIATSRLSD